MSRSLPFLLAALAACGPKGDDSGAADDTATATCASGAIALSDADNYSYQGSLDVPSIPTAAADVQVCWDGVSQDIQCHDLPADEIDRLAMVRFGSLTEDEVEAGLAGNDLQQADVSGYAEWTVEDGATCANLSDLSFFGTPIDIESEYTEDGGTYLLMLAEGTLPGTGARALAFLDPSASSDVTEIEMPDGCGILDFQADLASLQPLRLCAEGPWTLDWSGLTADAHGGSLDGVVIDTAMLGFYEGMSAADLEASFLDLELIPTHLYTATLDGGSSVDLASLSEDGTPFSGFDPALDGTWMFALRCSTCPNPAPVFLTLIEPE